VEIPEGGADGVLACAGGEFGGWTFFVLDGRLHYVSNYLKIQEYGVASEARIPPGTHELSVQFVPREKSLKPDWFGGDVTIAIDGEPVGELKDIKMAAQYSTMTGYGLLIGRNTGTPVSHLYETSFPFAGNLKKVTIQVDPQPQVQAQ
jgi:arylsulfatase